jgi:8-oxo-dGTP pyrophosphatase MutT (NUDIX family)
MFGFDMRPSKKNGLLEVDVRPVIKKPMNFVTMDLEEDSVADLLIPEDLANATLLRSFCNELRQPLPGRSAQGRMAPRPRPGWEADFVPPTPPRQGGVLVLFYPHQNQLYLPLILRPTYNGVHSGQVGFPGGGREAADRNITATALRESYEEIGVDPQDVQVLGQLTKLYITPSNYEVTPTVGWIPYRPDFQTDPHEVASLLEVPLLDLRDPGNCTEEEWQLRDRRATVPFFRLSGQVVWGATAMILSELLTVIDRC